VPVLLPLLPLGFVTELFRLAKGKGVNTAIDTAGEPFTHAQPFFGQFERLLPLTDHLTNCVVTLDSRKAPELLAMDGETLANHIAEQLTPLGGITRKRMFGGVGFCHYGAMVAILSRSNELYLKYPAPHADLGEPLISRRTDKTTGGIREIPLPYYRLPETALDNGDELRDWVRQAIARLGKP